MLGAGFVLICDIIGRLVRYPYEIPIGTVIGVVGSAIFLYPCCGGRPVLREELRTTARPAWEHVAARRAGLRLALLAALAVASVVTFLTINVVGNWTFVLSLRSTTVATMLLVGYAVAVSTCCSRPSPTTGS